MTTIQVIPTEYHNTLFRSRLEARWAVFFDALEVPWEFEPEAFGDGEKGYLPDFWLPNQNCYFEVKPDTNFDEQKIALACIATQKRVMVATGPVAPPDLRNFGFSNWDGKVNTTDGMFMLSAFQQPDGTWDAGGFDINYYWCECPVCPAVGIEFDGRGARVCSHSEGDKSYSPNAPRILEAFRKADRYRFWNPS